MSRRHRIGVGLASTMVAAVLVVGLLAVGALFAAPRAVQQQRAGFPHERHARVFPLCSTCHAGVVEPAQSLWPEPSGCASCHDGVVERRVAWQPRSGPRAGNRRFTHEAHTRAATAKNPADSALIRNCAACHNERGAPRMAVQNAVVGQCIDCHGFDAPHVDVPSAACATCHVRLTDAPGLTRNDIARFPKPRSHEAPGFVLGGHGKAAKDAAGASSSGGIAASCATCHARNLCLTCHVNAPESPVIRALALDDRSPPYATSQPVPPSHRASGFLRVHGREAQRASATCAVCHTRESCASCHVGAPPRVIAALAPAGPERAPGAHVTRTPPVTHTQPFREGGHGPDANARPTTCETCHVRSTCLECHRPEGTRQAGFHPQAFLTRHPSSAYAREANCSDCHNPAQFCQSCHQQSGLVATSRIGRAGYHDAFRGFSLGHGQAARQSLESCASCHAERDCTACHSAVGGGFRFNPHGPGFDAARLRSKNPSLCVACHGRAIPGGR
jgi:hypothetical protein